MGLPAHLSHARHRVLPAHGPLLVSTDLHGNGEDYRALCAIFLALRARQPTARWVLLGDLVHGPDERARAEQPELYGFPDESWAVVAGVIELRRRFADDVLLLLGNHDHAHVGGPHTHKFHADEVTHLEAALDEDQRAALRELFAAAPLVALTPCGVLLAHGSPGAALDDLAALDRLSLGGGGEIEANDEAGARLLETVLTSYGQTAEISAQMLRAVSVASGLDLRLVVHGHDRDEEGWFVDGPNQLCPVLFGAPRENKRYLLLDLGGRYESVDDVREGIELRRLHPSAGDGAATSGRDGDQR